MESDPEFEALEASLPADLRVEINKELHKLVAFLTKKALADGRPEYVAIVQRLTKRQLCAILGVAVGAIDLAHGAALLGLGPAPRSTVH